MQLGLNLSGECTGVFIGFFNPEWAQLRPKLCRNCLLLTVFLFGTLSALLVLHHSSVSCIQYLNIPESKFDLHVIVGMASNTANAQSGASCLCS